MCYLTYEYFNSKSKTKLYKSNSSGHLERFESEFDFVKLKTDNYEFIFNISNTILNEYKINLGNYKILEVTDKIYFTFGLPLAVYDLRSREYIRYDNRNIKIILNTIKDLFKNYILYDSIEFSAYKIFELLCNKYHKEVPDDFIILFTSHITKSQFDSLCKTHQHIVENIFTVDVFGNYVNEVLQYYNQVGLYNFILSIFRLYYYTGIKNLHYDSSNKILLYTQFDDYCIPYLNIKEFFNLTNHKKVFNIESQSSLKANNIKGTYDDSRFVKILYDELLGYYIQENKAKPILLNNINLEFKSLRQIDYFCTDIDIDINL